MKNILVDPILFLMPSESATKDEVAEWLLCLKSWLHEVSGTSHRWFHCADILLASFGYEHLPNARTLRRWQTKYQIEIDIHEIVNAFTAFFYQESFTITEKVLEAAFLAEGLYIEIVPTLTILSPPQYIQRWPEPIREEISQILALAGAGKSKRISFSCALSIATCALAMGQKELIVSGVASFLSDHEEQQEHAFVEVLPLLNHPNDVEPLDIIELWLQGEQGARRAIDRYFFMNWQQAVHQPLSFIFGPEFFPSLRQHRLDTSRVILTKLNRFIAALMANALQDLECDLHPIGEKGPRTPQLTRPSDGAKAWRAEIVPKGVGWRLQYWSIPSAQGSIIELVDIRKKHDPELQGMV